MKYVTENLLFKIFIVLILLFSTNIYSQAPKAALEGTDKIDFGNYPANEKKEAIFTISNKGTDPFIIKNIRKTCGCANISSSKMQIPYGETADIKVVMSPEGIYGAYSKNIYIETNDPEQKFISLSFTGNAIPAFTINPQDKINLGRIKTGETISQDFILDAISEDYLIGKPSVQSEIKTDVSVTKNGKKNTLNVKLFPGTYTGSFKCILNIPVANPAGWKPLEIILSGKAGYEMSVFPGKIQSYNINSEGNFTASFQVKILGAEKIDPKQITVMPLDGLELTMENSNSNTAECKLKIKTLDKLKFPLKLDITYPNAAAASIIIEKPAAVISR